MEPNEMGVSVKSTLSRFALACVYAAGNGKWWIHQTGWLSNESECLWDGISCDSDGQITSLALSDNNIQGILDMQIGLLQDLKIVGVVYNEIS
jgi:hypothetical protein